MPSISNVADRHIVIDKRDDQYICFPDVVRADDGRLVVAYNEADKHVTPGRRTLLVRQSFDNGRTWDDIVRLGDDWSHCPRLIKLTNGDLLLSDSYRRFHISRDSGDTWEVMQANGLEHDMIDRVTDLGEDVFLTTGHLHRGTAEQPAIRQAPTEQMAYRSDNGGKDWLALGAIGRERNLVLCEASMTRLADGRIAALMRENSFVYEPMYLCLSEDEGDTWSDPIPTPLIGHRPTMGLVPDGRLLVTYRNVGPDMGTSAWLGTLDKLCSGFKVHGRHADPANPVLTKDGLRVSNTSGDCSVVRYVLRPMTDPRSAKAVLEAEVRVDEADANACALRLGVWWRITPNSIEPDVDDAQPIPIEQGQFHTIRLEYAAGRVTLNVDGDERASIVVDDDHADTRPILFGAPYPFEDNAVDCTWRRVSLSIEEPRLQRRYDWKWTPEMGLPDQWVLDNILELRNARYTSPPDFGYSGWTMLDDENVFCTYHHIDGDDEEYDPLFTSHVAGSFFSLDDFGK
ncbi:sialidase family protein [Pseudodesulfovibrio sp. zrk46]|uniref:sialidase family protein n=1 Tax=Pseudodesulfovibrio sp. zrk46 TaxID=2725288 RepID=UPI001448BA31|nr:sialidase family protein [Pseudodesulfovibrio sp. zrk46]QJB56918.1 exo-alpha-sialidase [Pseudodesulfovibrio sp. zrk46]